MGKSLTGDDERIRALLELDEPTGDGGRKASAFTVVLEEAKRAANWADGGVARGEPPTSLGILGYLILLDLIGKCFAPKSWSDSHNPDPPNTSLEHPNSPPLDTEGCQISTVDHGDAGC